MTKTEWRKKKYSGSSIVWANTKNPAITIEAYDMEEQTRDEEDKGNWYVFGAQNGRAIPFSPEIVTGKQEAIEAISRLKKAYEESNIRGLN
jgi:uncharacterized protein YegP (UPF0339 family)